VSGEPFSGVATGIRMLLRDKGSDTYRYLTPVLTPADREPIAAGYARFALRRVSAASLRRSAGRASSGVVIPSSRERRR